MYLREQDLRWGGEIINVFELFAKLSLDSSEYESGLSKARKSIDVASKAIGAAVGAAATAVGKLAKDAVQSYASYEQLVGGVETLFKGSAGIVQEYAAKAYETAGLSANEYMETVTSFSASLLQSLGGNTELAAEVANRAITDMSDNANKMGTDMASIQNAYNGFAKQNFTMLDNLKLGYGGTQAEMQRLIADAAKMTDVQRELNVVVNDGDMSFGNIINAISVVQSHLGIMGTTAEEASKTISGSLSAMRSAWANLLTGVANDNADFDALLDNFIESAETAAKNLIPRIEVALQGVGEIITRLAPVIASEIPKLIEILTPPLLEAAIQLVGALAASLPDIGAALVEAALSLVDQVGNALAERFPALAVIFENLETIVVGLTAAFVAYKAVTIALAVAENGLAIAQALLNTVMSLNPIALVIAAIVALTAAVITLWRTNEGFRDFVIGYFNFIGEKIGEIVSTVQRAIQEIGNFFRNLWSEAVQWVQRFFGIGQEIVLGIWKGIRSAWDNLVQKFNELWDKLLGGVKDVLGIHSPSRVFANIGKNMALGVREGWENAFSGISEDINSSLDFGSMSIGTAPGMSATGGASYGETTGNMNGMSGGMNGMSGEQTINVEFTLRLDDGTVLQKMAHKLHPYIKDEAALRGGAIA